MMSYKLKALLQHVVLFFFFLTTAISGTIFLTIPFYRWGISLFSLSEETGLSGKLLIKNYHVLLNYLNNPWIKKLQMPDFKSSKSGLFHFYEVKKLFLLNHGLWLVLLIPAMFFLIRSIKKRHFFEMKLFFQRGAFFPLILGAIMSLGFDTFFVTFHHLFFNNDDWLFDPATDPVILALPENFFMGCFLLFFILFEGIMVIGYVYFRQQDKNRIN